MKWYRLGTRDYNCVSWFVEGPCKKSTYFINCNQL